jgi:hypothetical protein
MSPQDAENLIRHYRTAAGDQMLDQMAGTGSVPSSLSAHRADLMRRTCEGEKRILSAREMAVLLRVTDTTANAIRREMSATYEASLQSLLLDAALMEARWSTYLDGTGRRCAKLTLVSAAAATTVEYALRQQGRWAGVDRDVRAILFPANYQGWSGGIRPPKGLL